MRIRPIIVRDSIAWSSKICDGYEIATKSSSLPYFSKRYRATALFRSDVITIEKTGENFRLIYDAKGRYAIHRITAEEAKVASREFKSIAYV